MVSIVPPAADTYGTVSASVFVHSIKPILQLVDLLLSLPSAPFSYQMMQKKNMRQQDQTTERLRTSTAIAGKNKTGTRVKRVPVKGGIDVRHDRSIANHQPRLVSCNQS